MYALHFRICVEVLAFNDYNLHAVLNSQSMKLSSIPEITGMSIYLRSQNSQTFKDLSWINNFPQTFKALKKNTQFSPNFERLQEPCEEKTCKQSDKATRQPVPIPRSLSPAVWPWTGNSRTASGMHPDFCHSRCHALWADPAGCGSSLSSAPRSTDWCPATVKVQSISTPHKASWFPVQGTIKCMQSTTVFCCDLHDSLHATVKYSETYCGQLPVI